MGVLRTVTTAVVWAALGTAALAFEAPEARTKLVEGPIAKLTPILGVWEIDDQWADGTPLWARNEYNVGLGGKFVVANTYAKNPSGHVYHRYMTIFGYDQTQKEYYSWGFVYDGQVKKVPLQLAEEDGKLTLTSQWEATPGSMIRQAVTVSGTNYYDWKVWNQGDDGEWTPIMDGRWKRQVD